MGRQKQPKSSVNLEEVGDKTRLQDRGNPLHAEASLLIPEIKASLAPKDVSRKESVFPQEARNTWDNLSCGLIILSPGPDHQIEFWNRAVESWGLTRSQVLGKKYDCIVPKIFEEGRIGLINEAIKTGKTVCLKGVEHNSLRRGVRYQDLVISRFTDSKGGHHGMIEVDDTTESEFRRQMDGFAARILSHEIKNPVSVIGHAVEILSGDIRTLEKDFGIPPERMSGIFGCLGIAERNAGRINEIINSMLDTLKNERITLSPKRTDIRLLIQNTVDFIRPDAEQKKH
ncbi:MAG TPA: PAS domain-containing sensor histidine kinase [Candidatus Altiarchaeales archaeon]|nr:PAS domain-containing sensor histidine kinase [Candidatus Altiarchaeales archaeon]